MSVRSLCVDYPRGSHVPSHAHSWPQLLYAGQGTLRAQSGQNLWVVPPRRALWIRALARHELTMLSQVHLRTLYFRKNPWGNHSDDPRVLDVGGLLNEMILRTCDLGWLDECVHFEYSLAELLVGELTLAGSQALYLTLPEDPRALRLATS